MSKTYYLKNRSPIDRHTYWLYDEQDRHIGNVYREDMRFKWTYVDDAGSTFEGFKSLLETLQYYLDSEGHYFEEFIRHERITE